MENRTVKLSLKEDCSGNQPQSVDTLRSWPRQTSYTRFALSLKKHDLSTVLVVLLTEPFNA